MARGKIIQSWDEFFSTCMENIDIAVIGGGGKTGLISLMADKFQTGGQAALVTVTTRLGREQFPQLKKFEANGLNEAESWAERAFSGEKILLAGPFTSKDKLAGVPLDWFPALRRAAGPKTIFLIEADGSAGLPLKAHRESEPVLPPLENLQIIAVVGLSVLLHPWPEVVHRPEILADYISPPAVGQALSPRHVADFINSAWKRFKPDVIFLNQADLLQSLLEKSLGEELAGLLTEGGWTVFSGSLKEQAISE